MQASTCAVSGHDDHNIGSKTLGFTSAPLIVLSLRARHSRSEISCKPSAELSLLKLCRGAADIAGTEKLK